MKSDTTGAGLIALASLQFGGVVVLGKVSSDNGLPAIPVLSIRFAFAAVALLVVAAIGRRPLWPAARERTRLAVLGVFGYGVEAALFFLAIDRGTASAVTLLFFVYPVMVTLGSAALGARMPGLLIGASLSSAVVGAALVVASSGELDISQTGIFFALGSATAFALYLMGAERTLRDTSSLAGAAWVAGFASVGLALYSLATGIFDAPVGAQWLPVLGMGVFTAGAFVTLFAGLRRIGAVRTSIIAALEPLSTVTLAIVFLAEPVRAGTVAGGLLILIGAIAASLARGGASPAV